MLTNIIKRDGRIELFNPDKMNKWAQWSTNSVDENLVDWSDIVIKTVSELPETVTSKELQEKLIQTCLEKETWSYSLIAGKLYAALMHKDIFGSQIPLIREVHQNLIQADIMRDMGYSQEEYDRLESHINHDRDLEYPHYALVLIREKYTLKNEVTRQEYESPQFACMRIAMEVGTYARQYVPDVIKFVKTFYDYISLRKINIPTPYWRNCGTNLKGYASCCVFESGDTADSLDAGKLIAGKMTQMSAGIGAHLTTRSINDPVRGGSIKHLGKLPCYNAVAHVMKEFTQSGRGGAATMYYQAFDPEVIDIQALRNPLTPLSKQNRLLDYAMVYNKYFVDAVKQDKEVGLYSYHDAPELIQALYSKNPDKYEEVLEQVKAKGIQPKSTMRAQDILASVFKEQFETGRHYECNVTNMNAHTPFYSPIRMSNLCTEIALATNPYYNLQDLYKDGEIEEYVTLTLVLNDVEIKKDYNPYTKVIRNGYDSIVMDLEVGDTVIFPESDVSYTVKEVETTLSPEVGLCSLGGIVYANIENDDELATAAELNLWLVDFGVHSAHHLLPNIGYTSRQRISAGVAIVGLAEYMAKNGYSYSTYTGLQAIHDLSERHMYHLIKASLKLGKLLGNAPWSYKAKWKDGWLPVDTYKKDVDTIVPNVLHYDWESLRKEIIENGGIRNTVVSTMVPAETSSLSSATTNGVYPIRDKVLLKKIGKLTIRYIVPYSDTLEYESAWDIDNHQIIKVYALIQKWTDQAISVDEWFDISDEEKKMNVNDLIRLWLYRDKYGLKSHYYTNTKTTASADNLVLKTAREVPLQRLNESVEEQEYCESCTL